MKLICCLSLHLIYKSPGPSLSADLGTDATCFTDESDVEPEDRDRTDSPPSSPVISEVREPPQLPMNGMMGCITEIYRQCYWVMGYTVRHR